MTQKTIKAERATISLGDIDLNCLQFPDGSYHFYVNQVNEELGIKASDKTGKKHLKPLIDKDSKRVNRAKVENIKTPVKTYSLDLMSEAIQAYALIGNKKCIAVAIACVAESLERRADTAFNIKRTEEERNVRFQVRRDGILSRNFWTDSIDAYLNEVNYPHEKRWYVYSTISDLVNMKIIGLKAKAIKSALGLPKEQKTRDFLPTETLKMIDNIERSAALRLQHNETIPTQALKDVINFLGIEPDVKRLG